MKKARSLVTPVFEFADFVLLGYLVGGHVMRLCHGHDESLTIPGADKSEEEQRLVLRRFSSFFSSVPSLLVIKESLLQIAEIFR